MKIYPLITAVLAVGAYAQTPAPKPAATPAPAGNTAPQTPPIKIEAAPTQAPVDPNKVIATFGDQKITVAEFNDLIAGLPPQYQAQARGAGKRQMMEEIIKLKILANEATKAHLDLKPDIQKQIEFHKENILAGAEYQNLMNNVQVDDAAAKAYYDAHKSDYQEVQARHILIRFKGSPVPLKEGQKDLTEEEALAKAQEIEKRLKAGEDFAKIAKEESADTGSGANGGELGMFKHGQMVKPFEDAAFALQPGQISDPVKSQFGYHVIQTEKVVNKTFEEARPDINGKLKPEMAKKKVDELEKAANVKLDDSFFAPAPAAPPTLGAVK